MYNEGNLPPWYKKCIYPLSFWVLYICPFDVTQKFSIHPLDQILKGKL